MLTFIYAPADDVTALLWAKLALSATASIVVPLFEPFPYIPLDPTVRYPFHPEPGHDANAPASIRKKRLTPSRYARSACPVFESDC
jgi:hypothetical protein